MRIILIVLFTMLAIVPFVLAVACLVKASKQKKLSNRNKPQT